MALADTLNKFKAARDSRLGRDTGAALDDVYHDLAPDLFPDGPTPFGQGVQTGIEQREGARLADEVTAWVADNPIPTAIGACVLAYGLKKLLVG